MGEIDEGMEREVEAMGPGAEGDGPVAGPFGEVTAR